MNKRSGKVERLLRVNRFREDQSKVALLRQQAADEQAAASHREAEQSAAEIGRAKVRLDEGQRLDLAGYERLLPLERHAIGEAEARLAEAKQQNLLTAAVRSELRSAHTATRVADRRAKRFRCEELAVDEKQLSDQLAELWSPLRPGGQ